MTKPPFEITMTDSNEVRMGSPYNHCQIQLIGYDKVTLSRDWWQDKYAWSADFKKLILVKWNFEKNESGFHLVMIDIPTGQYVESSRIFGLPNSITIDNDLIKLNKFLYDKEKSSPGKLCCHIDEEFDLTKLT